MREGGRGEGRDGRREGGRMQDTVQVELAEGVVGSKVTHLLYLIVCIVDLLNITTHNTRNKSSSFLIPNT